VFEELYKKLEGMEEKGRSIIVICGDILHLKTMLSPELIMLTREFFRRLSKIMPLFMISGNHDMNMSNKEKLDGITPILEEDMREVYYMKRSGYYVYKNVVFGVSSLEDEKRGNIKILSGERIKEEYCDKVKIGLYHGTLDGVIMDNGRKTENKTKKSMFEGYDYVMLGDIHKHQYLDRSRRIGYSGSLIQQNHGESVRNHGMLKWDIEEGTSEMIEIYNRYSYITIEVNEGILKEEKKLEEMKGEVNLRVRYIKTSKEELEKVVKEICKKVNVVNLCYYEVFDKRKMKYQNMEMEKMNEEKYQSEKIRELLKGKYKNEMIEGVCELNKYYNDKMCHDKAEILNSNVVRIKRIEFTNMFCYGENNVYNFEKTEGVVGIVGNNHIGKSAIMDVLLCGLYDKCTRGNMKSMRNVRKRRMGVCVYYECNKREYMVERVDTNQRDNRTVVYYYEIIGGKKKELNGLSKSSTMSMIEKQVGTYENFLNTSIILQKDGGFVGKSNTERKNMLYKMLKIDIFDKILKKIKESKTANLAILNDKKRNELLKLEVTNINNYKIKVEEIKNKKLKIGVNKSQIKEYREKIKHGRSQIIEIDEEVEDNSEKIKEIEIKLKRYVNFEIDIVKEKNKKENLLVKLTPTNDRIINYKQDILKINKENAELNKQLGSVECDDDMRKLLKDRNKLQAKVLNVKVVDCDIEKIAVELDNCKRKKVEMNKRIARYNRILKNKISEEYFQQLEQKNVRMCEVYREKLKIEEEIESAKTIMKRNKQVYDLKCECCVKNKKNMEAFLLKSDDSIAKLEDRLKILNGEYDNKVIKLYEKSVEKIKLYNESISKLKNELENRDIIIQKINMLRKEMKDKKEEMKILENNNKYNTKIEEIDKRIMYVEKKEELTRKIEYNKDKLKIYKMKQEEYEINSERIKLNELLKKGILECENKILKYEEKELYEENYKRSKIEQDKYEKNKGKIEKNEELKEYIEKLEDELEKLVEYQEELNDEYYSLKLEKLQLEKDLIKTADLKKVILEKRKIVEIESIYEKCVNKDGIPLMILNDVITRVESRVNEILSEISELSIKMRLENDKIEMYMDKNGKELEVSLCSGYERSCINIAVKLGLNDYTRNIQTNVMIMDEIFGQYDSENINNIQTILNGMRNRKDNIIVITHNEELKGNMDNIVNIRVEKGESKITLE
jgi:DNA repair exonuclease SbcCD ATPase subunit